MSHTHHRSTLEVVAVWLASVATGILCVAIIWFTGTIWWPYEPVTKLDIRVMGTPQAGGLLVVEVDYCKPEESTPAVVRWTLINEITILLEDGSASLPSGCHVTQRMFDLSPHTPPARYRLQVEGIYRPWPWRQVHYLRRSPVFEIKP